MPAPIPNTQDTKETAPAQPGKTFLIVLGLTCCFYLVDCTLVTIFQDHPNSPWIEWGIHAGGPAGFGATVIVFLLGVVHWFREVARQADEVRNSPVIRDSKSAMQASNTQIQPGQPQTGKESPDEPSF